MFAVDCEFGKTIVATCTCECGALLTLPWGGAWGIDSFVIKCAADPSHDKVVPVKSFYQMWKDDEELPSFIKDNIERKLRRKIMEQNNVKALVVKQDADKLSTYLQARFPQDLARREVALDFAKWCIAHQLEPIRDCIPYHGNPYITIEWVDRQASEDKTFKGYSYKVFSQQDKETLDFDPKDLVAECQANWEGLEKPLVGLGVVTKLEKESVTGGQIDEATGKGYRSPVLHLKPQQMVFKRARAATFKQRYHIPAPILEELPYTTVVEAEYRIIPEPEGEETGKAVGEKVAAAAPTKARAQATNPVSAPAAEEKSPDEAIEGEGFSIDSTWLSESQKTLKWTGDTMLSFLAGPPYKVSGKTVTEALRKLTREQAEDFTREINGRLEKQQPELV